MKHACVGQNRFGWTCDRAATVIRCERHYCWQHDPERLEKIRLEKQAARKAELKRDEDRHNARIARRILEEQAGVDKLTDADLRSIIALGGIRGILLEAEAQTFNDEEEP